MTAEAPSGCARGRALLGLSLILVGFATLWLLAVPESAWSSPEGARRDQSARAHPSGMPTGAPVVDVLDVAAGPPLHSPCEGLGSYVGCAPVSRTPRIRKGLLSGAVLAGEGMSSSTCQLLCYTLLDPQLRAGTNVTEAIAQSKAVNYEFYGLLDGDCYCAHTAAALALPPTPNTDPKCGSTCRNEERLAGVHVCGNGTSLAVYTSGFPAFVEQANATQPAVVKDVNDLACVAGARYRGCFRHGMGGCSHNGDSNVLPMQPFGVDASRFTTTECQNACYGANYSFFGIANVDRRCYCGNSPKANDAKPKPFGACGSFGGLSDPFGGAARTGPYISGGCAKEGYLPPTFTCGQILDEERALRRRYASVSCWMSVFCTGVQWFNCTDKALYF
mmetsp:Transcript_4959/g.13651  ORF Transcript_4959/g.13651 Transcript_4959/m.13651 type:complete len:390 (+) Transcript_4959:45-1214(+)